MKQKNNKHLKLFLFVVVTIVNDKIVETVMNGVFLAFFEQDLSEIVANLIRNFLN